MPKHVLISPLGFSPGAVSGVAFGLQRGVRNARNETVKYPIEQVITLGTKHDDVGKSAGHLVSVLGQAKIAYSHETISQQELRQTDGSVATFVARMGQILETVAGDDTVVHVAITGGRSGMGALAALAASLYGAAHLWHLWVEEEIERMGRIGVLPQPFDMSNIYLNPPPEKSELVELPFMDMRPFHPLLWAYYRRDGEGGLPEGEKTGLHAFLTAEVSLADIFPAGATLRHKQQINELARQQADAATASPQLANEVVAVLVEAGLTNAEDSKNLKRILRLNRGAAALLAEEQPQAPDNPFWAYLQAQQETIQAIVAAGKQPISLTQLREQMISQFDLGEIKTLSLDLSVDFDNLPGEGKKVKELITYLERRGRLAELVALLRQTRPRTSWLDDAATTDAWQRVTEADLFLLYGLQSWLIFRGQLRAVEVD